MAVARTAPAGVAAGRWQGHRGSKRPQFFEAKTRSRLHVGHALLESISEMFGATGNDPGHWNLSPEWMGTQGDGWGRNAGVKVFQGVSQAGNGKEWRVLRFNEQSRQAVNRVVVRRGPSAGETTVQALPSCIAWPYLKSMVAAACGVMRLNRALEDALMRGELRVECIGLGGGTLPLFLAHHFPSMHITAIELDPLVVEATRTTMGLASLPPNLSIVEADAAEHYAQLAARGAQDVGLLLIDAFDGENNVPRQLCTPGMPFLQHMPSVLDAEVGTVVQNLHSEGTSTMTAQDKLRASLGLGADKGYDPNAELGSRVELTAQTLRSALLGPSQQGAALTLADTYSGGNITAVVARGLDMGREPRAACRQLQGAAAKVAAESWFTFPAERYLQKLAFV